MPNTYVALATQTASSASSVVFDLTGISGYTDLVIVAQAKSSTAGSSVNSYRLRFNGLSTTLYSNTSIQPNGSSTSSTRDSSSSEMYVGLLNQTSASLESSIIHIMNYANTNVFKTVLARGGSVAGSVNAIVGLWRSTAAITSIELFMTSATLTGTFSLYGIANADQGSAKATGGIITEDSQYWYHTFGATSAFVPKQSLTADILVIAGGGSGGLQYGGGGGAGGLVYTSSASLASGTSYTCTVGAGAPKAVDSGTRDGSNGNNSTVAGSGLTTITATGGGLGGGDNGNVPRNGGNGGSGGGGSATSNGMGSGGTGSQGFNGAAGVLSTVLYGGGGGGAGEAGNTDGLSFGGDGSSAYSSWGIATGTGQNVSGTYFYAGGGGGSANVSTPPEGGAGGGGAGGKASGGQTGGVAGTANTGGGGGAGWGGGDNSGPGGSGVVIVRYAK